MRETARTFKELGVWQAAMDLVESVYRLSACMTVEEMYGLSPQMRLAAVSIPTNIAEGQACISPKEFVHHLSMALASLAEVETQLEISLRLKYLLASQVEDVDGAIQRLGRQLHALCKSLETRR